MKKCFKCNEVKPLAEFYKHPQMLDGHVNKCKECNKKDVRENRVDKLQYYREYDKARRTKAFVSEEEWKELSAAQYLKTKEYRRTNPKKYKAHQAVGRAISKGLLIPRPCEVCGNDQVHGHHCDYNKPLEVVWLCSEHHVAWHKEHGEGANAH
jgi:hypothetical protein